MSDNITATEPRKPYVPTPGELIEVTLVETADDIAEALADEPHKIWVRCHAVEERDGETVVYYADRGTPYPLPAGRDVAEFHDAFGKCSAWQVDPIPPVVAPEPFVFYEQPDMNIVHMSGKVQFEDVMVTRMRQTWGEGDEVVMVPDEPELMRKWTLFSTCDREGRGGTVLELDSGRREHEEGYSVWGKTITEGWPDKLEGDNRVAWKIEGGNRGSDCDGPSSSWYEQESYGGADPEAPAWFAGRSPRTDTKSGRYDAFAAAAGY